MTNNNKIVDSWLVLQLQAGNEKALGLLVKRWHKKLCRHAAWYTKDIDVAKDVVQDSWSVIILRIGSLKDPDKFSSWALSVVTRKAIDWLRKQKSEQKKLTGYYDNNNNNSDADNIDDSEESLILMRQHMDRLPDSQKMVLHLFYLEELSIKQISEVLKLPKGTIKSRLFNAREKLKLTLKDKSHEK